MIKKGKIKISIWNYWGAFPHLKSFILWYVIRIKCLLVPIIFSVVNFFLLMRKIKENKKIFFENSVLCLLSSKNSKSWILWTGSFLNCIVKKIFLKKFVFELKNQKEKGQVFVMENKANDMFWIIYLIKKAKLSNRSFLVPVVPFFCGFINLNFYNENTKIKKIPSWIIYRWINNS